MDPVSQACLGASLSQSFAHDKSKQFSALVIGSLAGMAPDLDFLIRSDNDPLLFLEYHRQFTHSLFFIPFGALICAVFFYLITKTKTLKTHLPFPQIYLFSFLGYGTHGLLDACTSYGTQLYWPFSNERISWNLVSIIDPLFTIPITFFVLFAAFRKKPHLARIGFMYAIVFLLLGNVQNYRAEAAANILAEQRGHQPSRLLVKPSFGNRHLWKIVYEYNDRYYVDAVKLLLDTKIIPGNSIQKLNIERDLPWLNKNNQQTIDIERFRWFSDDFIALNTQNPEQIMDVRYSLLPNQINSMWGIELNRKGINKEELKKHAEFKIIRHLDKKTREKFMDMLF